MLVCRSCNRTPAATGTPVGPDAKAFTCPRCLMMVGAGRVVAGSPATPPATSPSTSIPGPGFRHGRARMAVSRPGRPRVHASAADRARAYRQRKKAEGIAANDALLVEDR
jgi:hypothetical protein